MSSSGTPSREALRKILRRPVNSGWNPCAQLEQRGNLAVCRNLAASRLKSAHEQFQQRRLAGSVIADDAEALAIGYGEGNISQHMVNLVSRTP
jgi:hypothetical protein